MSAPRTSEPDASPGLLSRLGEACLLALAVAIFASVPTALRTAGSGGSFLEGLVAGAAVLLPLLAASLGLARAAGRGFRGITGTPVPRAAVFAIALWIGLSVPAMAALGAVLKATTHHRGLAGATFAIFGAALVASLAVVAHRLVALGQALVARGVRPWLPIAATALVALVPLAVMAAPVAGPGGGEGAGAVRAAVVDGAIAIVATLLVTSLHLGASVARAARLAGVPLAVVVLIAGVARIESSPPLAKAMREGGGLPATILEALEAWTDRDHDGAGAHFGGFDCDEGDPSRHPGAVEIPGDGVDQDCDGVDPPPPPAPLAKAPASAPSGAAAPMLPASVAPRAAGAPGSSLPDLVLVTLDSVRADHTSLQGYAKETTPRLAELASRGTVFEHAYATAADTQRTLAPLVSGRRLADTAHDAREWPTLLPEVETVAERLKKAGYATIAVASFTWMSHERGFSQGFDRFETVYGKAHPERSVTGPLAASAATSLWKQFEQVSAPVFLWVHLFDAHERWLEHPGISMGKGTQGLYDGEVAFVDKQLGALMDAIAASPRGGRVAWVVHGTHGVAFDEHGSGGHTAELYDELLHVPLVVALPGLAAARYGADAVSTLDVPATVVELGGGSLEGLEGASLLPMVKGDLARKHGVVFARAPRRAALVDWPLKLLVMERKRTDRHLLFDLAADPGETRDVSEDRKDDLARLVEARVKLDRREK
jgi:arylsulfatase A-like enzyme